MATRKTDKDNDALKGTNAADTLIVDNASNVTLAGGRGNDTYWLIGNDTETHVIIEDAGEGIDTILWSPDSGTTDTLEIPDNVENVIIRGNDSESGDDNVYGNELNNRIDASQSDESSGVDLYGDDGNDTLIGSKFNDGLYGGYGNDTLRGGRGDDSLYGGAGNDNLNGEYGDDVLYGDDGDDTLDGGNQISIASYEWEYGYGGDDVLYGGDGNDTLLGGNDTLIGTGYTSSLYAGSDKLYGGEGNDVLRGGNDTLRIEEGYADVLYGGNDMLYGDDGNDTLIGGNDLLVGSDWAGNSEQFYASTDHFYGGYGNDRITIGNRTVIANDGRDGIYGGYSYADGGFGNDVIRGGIRNFNGGGGDDVIFGVGEDTGDQDTFEGGYGNDTITGGRTTLTGGAGNDMLYGNQVTYYGDRDVGANNNDELDGNDRITGRTLVMTGGTGDDRFYAGYERFYGGGGNDILTGGNQTIRGDAGDDRVYMNGRAMNKMYGGYGDDTLTAGRLTINLGPGDNMIYGDNRDTDIDYGYGGGYAFLFGGYGNDTLRGNNGDDFLDGGYGDDTLLGNNGDDKLFGGYGNDVLNGGAGDDILVGGYGSDMNMDNDTLIGGAGDDQFYVSAEWGNDSINAGPGDDTAFVDEMATFNAPGGLENVIDNTGFSFDSTFRGNALHNQLYGGDGDDTLIGLGGDDLLDGGQGEDVMDGGAGNDSFLVDAYGDEVIERPGQGDDTVFITNFIGQTNYLPDNVENMTLTFGAGISDLIGSDVNNTLIGNAFNNVFYGGLGNDTLVSGGGQDIMNGGRGNDTYIVDGDFAGPNQNDDLVAERVGGGNDSVFADGDFWLGPNLENLTITSDDGQNAWGNDLNNRIEGGDGNDFIIGGRGNDTLIGRGGNDQFLVDSLQDTVIEAANGGVDEVTVDTPLLAGTFVLTANVENGNLLGTGTLNLNGNNLDNNLQGNNSHNVLNGFGGDDILLAGGGADTLFGGPGDDILNGGTGADLMRGNPGDDLFFVDRGDGAGTAIAGANEDRVIEGAGQGIDSVRSAVYTYSLPNNVENLTLEPMSNVARMGFGNNLANEISGNALANTLGGGAGNDTLFGLNGDDMLFGDGGNDVLDGGSGADMLFGGPGNDTFVRDNPGDVIGENLNEGRDLEQRFFNDGTNLLAADVEDLTLYGGANTGYGNTLDNVITGNVGGGLLYGGEGNDRLIGSAQFDRLFGGTDNDTLIGNEGSDGLYGNDGNDRLEGGKGDDFLDGGAGNDRMDGGFGDDLFIVDSSADVLVEGQNAGTDEVHVKSLGSLSVTLSNNIEDLFVYGNGGGFENTAHTLSGNGLDNRIFGGYGGDTLSGGAGNDDIRGAFGANTAGTDVGDTLDGGAGDDSLQGFTGDDILIGGTGDDLLDGGTGNDRMTGGAGDDLFIVDSGDGAGLVTAPPAEDQVIEAAGGGTDTVQIDRASGLTDYTLPAQVENLWVTGVGTPLTAVGNNLANTFTFDVLTDTDSADGLGGNDAVWANVTDSVGANNATLANISDVHLWTDLNGLGTTWDIATGNVAGQAITLDGTFTFGDTLTLSDVASDHTVALHNLNGFGALEVVLNNAGGASDTLSLDVFGATNSVGLVSAGIESVDVDLNGSLGLDVLFSDATDFVFNNGDSVLASLTSLADTDTLHFQGTEVTLLNVAHAVGGPGSMVNLSIDNTAVGVLTDLNANLDTLNIDTRGDPGFDTGDSFLGLGGLGATDIVLIGGQDLTVQDLSSDNLDASGFSGNLAVLSSMGPGVTITAGLGDDYFVGSTNPDTFAFGANLTNADEVFGDPLGFGGGGDLVTADVAAGTHTFHISGVEQIDLTLTEPGAFSFDLGEIDNPFGNIDINVLGDTTADVTFTLPDSFNFTGYDIDASGQTTGIVDVTTGIGGDTLQGGGGDDLLNPGGGVNTVDGNGGADTFFFGDNLNLGIADFTTLNDFSGGAGDGDLLALSLSVFGDIGTPGAFNPLAFESGAGLTAAATADGRIIYDTAAGDLYYDGDGTGGDAALQFATLAGAPVLAATDIDVTA